MKKIIWLLAMGLISLVGMAGDSTNIYLASTIKKELTDKAISVTRLLHKTYTVEGPDKAIVQVREVTTLLSPKAENGLIFTLFTDKFRYLDELDLKLFDANGKMIDHTKKKDLNSSIAGSGLVEDGKVFYAKLSTATYPVTMEAVYSVKLKGIYQLPEFQFSSPLQSVEVAKLELKHPSNMVINYKMYGINQQPRRTNTGGITMLVWEVKDLPAIQPEANSGNWRYTMPHVTFNMSNFEYDGYPGDMTSWKTMGLWYNSIVGGNNRLNARNQEDVKTLVAGVTDQREKVKKLYNHLQKNFRYVSIQLGIGGFRPFPADFVHEKKYGDCKGLSNYMEACLAAIGIRSYNVWINSGDEDVILDADFPHDSFDHQILMVPLDKDTVWLECTSNVNDFGHLGSFTENRYGLALTETGGKLIRTPAGKASENILISSSTIKLSAEGEAEIQTAMQCTGQFKYLMIELSRISADEQKTYLLNFFGMKQPDEFKLTYDVKKDQGYVTNIELFAEKGYEFKAGSKLFFRPRIYKNWSIKLEENKDRKQDFYIDYPFTKIDTTIFILPEGIEVETLPSAWKTQFSAGNYESNYWFDKPSRKLYAVSKLTLQKHNIQASAYQEAKKFFDQVLDDGNQKIILLNNNALTKL